MQKEDYKRVRYKHFKKFTEKFITFEGFKFEHIIFARNLRLNIVFKNCNLKNIKFDGVKSGCMVGHDPEKGIKYIGGLKFINCTMDNVFINGWGRIVKKNCEEFMVTVNMN